MKFDHSVSSLSWERQLSPTSPSLLLLGGWQTGLGAYFPCGFLMVKGFEFCLLFSCFFTYQAVCAVHTRAGPGGG